MDNCACGWYSKTLSPFDSYEHSACLDWSKYWCVSRVCVIPRMPNDCLLFQIWGRGGGGVIYKLSITKEVIQMPLLHFLPLSLDHKSCSFLCSFLLFIHSFWSSVYSLFNSFMTLNDSLPMLVCSTVLHAFRLLQSFLSSSPPPFLEQAGEKIRLIRRRLCCYENICPAALQSSQTGRVERSQTVCSCAVFVSAKLAFLRFCLSFFKLYAPLPRAGRTPLLV